MNTRPNSLGIVYIETQWDNSADFDARRRELDGTVPEAYYIVKIDGDKVPDLSTCLNRGIQTCIEAGVEYIHWCHGDFKYTDPFWFKRLRDFLVDNPQVLKACASNSRDEIHPLRIGQEQTHVYRAIDFLKYPWLFFDQRYIRCGGSEDYAQHLNLLARGYLICITPSTSIFHKGAQTRGKYNTNKEALINQGIFAELTGFGGLVEVHQPCYWGCALSQAEREEKKSMLSPFLRNLLGDCETVDVGDRQAFLNAIFPQSPQAQAILLAQAQINQRGTKA